MTRYLLANLAGLLLLAGGGTGLALSTIVLLDGWQLVFALSGAALLAGRYLARLDGGDV